MKWLVDFLPRLKEKICKHEFMLSDLKQTGIPPLKEPIGKDYFAWQKYYAELYTHESHTRRVSWPCCKCGKVFYAHCGLDISPQNGMIITGKKAGGK